MAKFAPKINNAQFINGIPASGAKIFTYAAGSSTKQTTYTGEDGLVPQTNPIILNSRGEPDQPVWLTEGLSYKFVFTASTDSDPPVSPIWDDDDVTGINDASLTIDQWLVSGVTPTYVSATQFTLPGDQTTAFAVGRRIKATVTAGTVYGTITTSAFGALTTVTVFMDGSSVLDSGLSAVQYGILTPTNSSIPKLNLRSGDAINESISTVASAATPDIWTNTSNNINYTGAVTATGFAAAPQAGVRRTLILAAAASFTAGANMLIDGVVSFTGAAGDEVEVTAITTTQFRLRPKLASGLPVITNSKIQPITASVAANALTITLSPTSLDFRSTTLGSGSVTTVSNTSAISLVVSSGSTLGSINAIESKLVVIALNNAGTMELAVVNLSGSNKLDETNLISTTAEGGAGGADSATVIYSTAARSSVAYRIVGFIESTQATAGTWATAPSTVQGVGGQAIAALSSLGYGQTWQTVTRNSGTTYYNTTGKPIMLMMSGTCSAAAGNIAIAFNGGISVEFARTQTGSGTPALAGTVLIPASVSYVVTLTNVTLTSTSELR